MKWLLLAFPLDDFGEPDDAESDACTALLDVCAHHIADECGVHSRVIDGPPEWVRNSEEDER